MIVQCKSVKDIVFKVLEEMPQPKISLFAMIIWNARNAKVWEDKRMISNQIVFARKHFLCDWIQANQVMNIKIPLKHLPLKM